MQLTIRPATRDDLEDVFHLYHNFYKELRAKQGWSPPSVDECRKEVEGFLQRDKLLIAFLSGKAIGFVRVSERESPLARGGLCGPRASWKRCWEDPRRKS